jgi:cytochrome b561
MSSLEKAKREKLKYRIKVHLFVFIISFVFTVGASVLGVLLWVRPESFVSIVLVGLFASVVFIFCFTALRMFILHRLNTEDEEEKELGVNHHLSKSIAYSLVALVFAVVLAGLIVNVASASALL